MKKRIIAATAALLSLTGTAFAAEWQPIGAVGIGGAGVARQNGAFTAYWNPAGGAFNNKSFSFMTGVEFGARGSDGLTDNVDKLSKINFDSIKNLSGATATPQSVADAVKLIGILNDVNQRGGNLALTGSVPVGFTVKHLSFGIYGNFEGYVQPIADTNNILPTQTANDGAATVTDIYNALSTSPQATTPFFTADQQAQLVTTLEAGGLTAAQATQTVGALQYQLQLQGQSPDVAFTSANTLITSISSGAAPTNTIDKNTTSAMTKALVYAEVPIAYGHPFNLGKYGTLGVGLAIKPIRGVVFQNQVLLVNNPSGGNVKSGDLLKQLSKNKEESTSIGVDAGLLWKKNIWSVGLVAKNLNSPSFTAPTFDRYSNSPTTGAITVTKERGSDVTLDPMVRAGVAVDPWSWLTLAADMDLTKNSSVVPSTAVKSQNLGGGLEIHPWSVLKVRLGAMQNIAQSGSPLIGTFGFTLGPLDFDLAASTKTFKVGSTTIPNEVKSELMLGFTF